MLRSICILIGEVGAIYTIGTLSSLSGLSTHTIRAWEKRYQALTPQRTDSNRRLYTEEDVERLTVLKRLVASGHTIGRIAYLSTDDLHDLGKSKRQERSWKDVEVNPSVSNHFLNRCVAAMEALDQEAFEKALSDGTTELEVMGLINGVVLPILSTIEMRWTDGELRISQEHLATAVLRTHLDQLRRGLPPLLDAPRMLVTTPAGQVHELGAVLVAIVASLASWNVTYLGPNMPSREIADAVSMTHSEALGLSLVYPEDDPDLGPELADLRARVGSTLPIFVGGRATKAYQHALTHIRAITCNDLNRFARILSDLRVTRQAG